MKVFLFLLFLTNAVLSPTFGQNWESTSQRATAEQKPILLVFSGSDWCKPCIRFEKEVLQAAETKAFLDSTVVLYKADFPRNKKRQPEDAVKTVNQTLFEAYNTTGSFPMIVILSSDMTLIEDFPHYISQETLRKAISTAIKLPNQP